jgi:hypothetical protein
MIIKELSLSISYAMDVPLCGDLYLEQRLKETLAHVCRQQEEVLEEEERTTERTTAAAAAAAAVAALWWLQETVSTIYFLRALRYVLPVNTPIAMYVPMNAVSLLSVVQERLSQERLSHQRTTTTTTTTTTGGAGRGVECASVLCGWGADVLEHRRRREEAATEEQRTNDTTARVLQHCPALDVARYR